MTTKEYLQQIGRLDRMIKNKLSELSQLREMAQEIHVVTGQERVQTSPNLDKIGSAYCKIESMETDINKMIDNYYDTKKEIIAQIDSIENETYYNVLFARYIERKTFETIASEMTYSFRNTTRVHGKALMEFEKKYGHLYLKK